GRGDVSAHPPCRAERAWQAAFRADLRTLTRWTSTFDHHGLCGCVLVSYSSPPSPSVASSASPHAATRAPAALPTSDVEIPSVSTIEGPPTTAVRWMDLSGPAAATPEALSRTSCCRTSVCD